MKFNALIAAAVKRRGNPQPPGFIPRDTLFQKMKNLSHFHL